MNLVQTEAPADLAELILQSVCDHLRRNVDLDDSPPVEVPDLDYIRTCTKAAVSRLDGPPGRLRRALLTQTWALKLPCFPPVIELPLPPVQSVSSIKYLDMNGDQQTLDASKYRVSGIGSWQTEISPVYGEIWPDARYLRDAIEIEFITGFGDDATAIPETILEAIRLLSAHYYAERQPVTFASPQEIPLLVKDLLAPWRVYQ
jgi:uncharacterized phiE125 gp8 family phage protein